MRLCVRRRAARRVGGGLVLNGRLYRGATGAGAEIGHILIGADLTDGAPKPADRFPQPGSLEALASGTALDHLARDFAQGHPDGALGRAAAASSSPASRMITGPPVARSAM